MNFITNKENKELVNLDKVTCIIPDKSAKKIHFIFDSMIEGYTNKIEWHFSSEQSFNKVMSYIESLSSEV